MKKKIISLILVLSLLCSLCLTAFAATGTAKANNGVRHKLCTALSTQATAYYTGSYTFSNLCTLPGASGDSYTATQNNELYDALYTLMSSTQSVYPIYSGYSANALATYWRKTDATNGVEGYYFFYTDRLSTEYSGTLNREHVWPKSKASYYQLNGGADLHHLRPSIDSVNLAKYNHTFGNIVGVLDTYSTAQIDGKDVIWYSGSAQMLEVQDNIKGDVARILLYVYCRWQQPNLYSDVSAEHLPALDSDDVADNGLKAIESLDTLLEWCEEDPVDDWEMGRNDQIENIQGNRNVFIDYPELAWLMFNETIPQNMPTPSSGSGHTHSYSATVVAPTCDDKGYTRHTCSCGASYQDTPINALGHNWNDGKITKEPTETTAGCRKYTCLRCGETKIEEIPATAESSLPFTDVSQTAWYYDAVSFAHDRDLFLGTSATRFSPEGEMTRAMLVTVLWRLEHEPTPAGEHPFIDVPENTYYTDAVAWAQENKIVNGIGNGRFDPDGSVTREQIAAIMFRYAGEYRNEETGGRSDTAFPDGAQVSDWARDALSWANYKGLITGSNENGTTYLLPQGRATRSQVAAILMRYVKNYMENE